MLKAIRSFIRNSLLESFYKFAVVCDGNVHYAFTYAEALEWAKCYSVRVFGKVEIFDDKGSLIAAKF